MKLLTPLVFATMLPFVLVGPTLAQAKAEPTAIAYAEYATLVSQDISSPINVRDGASTNANARHIAYAGDRVEVIDRTVGRDGYMWFQVRFVVSNATGWIRGDFISLDGENY